VTAELARAAQSGSDDAFALLIEQNVADMRAVAIAVLGYVDEAEDVVQDAVLVALRKLPQLRDPHAAGPWLRAIVRNNCRMLLRSRRAVPVAEPEPLLPPDGGLGPDEVLDRAGTRDWVQHAVASLPEPVREVIVLRYFTANSSYRQIAELCALPEHTVRHRLRDGRRALERALHETATTAYADSGVTAADCRHEAEESIRAGLRGEYHRLLRDRFHPDAVVTLAGRLTGDRSVMVGMMDYTYGAGVIARLRNTSASRDVMVWEMDFHNPPDDPEHCSPGIVWLHTLRQGRIQRLRLAYRRTPVD
jgi:RNA polymerase sigma factor (sigma-70 family)